MTESDRYLTELRGLLPRPRRRRIVAELQIHLRDGIAAEMAKGLDREEAERLTITRLGPPDHVAAEFAADAPHDRTARIAKRLRGRRTALAAATALSLAVLMAAVGITTTRPAASAAGVRLAAAHAALSQIGTPYSWGGDSPSRGFDASGIVVWAYAQVGRRDLPHNSFALWRLGSRVPRAQLKPGDLVFFDQKANVGIYLGSGEFIDAPHTGARVQVEHLDTASPGYVGAIRPNA